MKQVEEERLQNVLAMVPQHQCRASLLARDPVEMSAPQPRAERAVGTVFRDLVGDDGICVLILDAMLDSDGGEIIGQDVLGKIRLPLVQIAGQKLDRQQPAPFEIEQQRQQPIGILAARQRHKPALARLHHREIFEGLARIAQQPLAQLVELDRRRRVAEQCEIGCPAPIRFLLFHFERLHLTSGRFV